MKGRILPKAAECWEQSDPLRPEKNLLLGVLERAIRDAARMKGVNARLDAPEWRRAVEWLEIGDPIIPLADPPAWSYQWICRHLGLDPACIHRHLRKAHGMRGEDPTLIEIIRRRLNKITFAHRDSVIERSRQRARLKK